MTTTEELDWIKQTAKNCNVIVEYGPWIGQSTISLISGLNGSGTLHTYDTFIWQKYMYSICNFGLTALGRRDSINYKIGDSFLKEFKSNIGFPLPNVNIHVGEIENMTWENGPIDFILIDAYKAISVVQKNLPEIFPYIKIGGIIADQDFFYMPFNFDCPHFFMHVVMFRLKEFFVPYKKIHSPRGRYSGTLMAFKKIKKVSRKQCQIAVKELSNTSLEEALEVCKYSLSF
jgi:hypothetical protein